MSCRNQGQSKFFGIHSNMFFWHQSNKRFMHFCFNPQESLSSLSKKESKITKWLVLTKSMQKKKLLMWCKNQENILWKDEDVLAKI